MAQLKNSVVNGDLIVTDSTLTDSLQVTTVIAPTASGSYEYGTGEDGQALRSNGTTTYWGNLPTYTGMTESEIDAGTGTYNRTISPKNLKYAVRKYETANSDNMMQLYYNGYTTMNILDCYGISSATQKTSFIMEFNNEVLDGTYEFAAYIVTLSSVTNCTITFYNSDNSSVGTCQLTTNSASAHATVSLSDIAVKMTLSFQSSTTISIDSFGLFPKFMWDYAYEQGFIINMAQSSIPTPLITQKLNKLKSDYDDVKIDVTNMQSQQTKNEAALINLINSGSKNMMPTPDGQSVPPTRWINISVTLQPGTYRVFFSDLQSDDTDDTRCQACFLSGSTQVSNWLTFDRGTDVFSGVCTITEKTSTFRLYPSTSYASSVGDTVTFTGCMICKESDWQISQEYVPYCPTLPEIYALIKSYHP